MPERPIIYDDGTGKPRALLPRETLEQPANAGETCRAADQPQAIVGEVVKAEEPVGEFKDSPAGDPETRAEEAADEVSDAMAEAKAETFRANRPRRRSA